MLNKVFQLITQILEMHKIKTKGGYISEQPQEIILLFSFDTNTNPLTKFLTRCQIPYQIDTDPQTDFKCLNIFF